jgi:DNA-binding NarL/FixJ family response regulator
MENVKEQLEALWNRVAELEGKLSRPNGYDCREPWDLSDMASMSRGIDSIGSPLTYREREILGYIAGGNTNKKVGYILGISEQTIKNHISTIFDKIGARDRAHAVYLAMCHGWLSAKAEQRDLVTVS